MTRSRPHNGCATPKSPAAGYALGYAPGGLSPTGVKLWVWQEVNCHPADPSDPELAPYGAAFAAQFHHNELTAA